MERPNFDAPLALADLEFWRDALIDELLTRTLLLTAQVDTSKFGYGIVDSADPVTATTTSPRTLSVSVNVANLATVDINPGVVVCPNGEIVRIPTLIQQVALANGAGNAKNVVYIEFAEQASAETALTHSDVPVSVRFERLSDPRDYIKTADFSVFSTFSPATLLKIVPLALVSVETTSTGNVLVVDHSRSSLSTNRPWFTAVDIRHRSWVGTGSVTSTNPHGTSLSDLSATSGKTLFQLQLEHGMIVGKDIGMAKVPGFICTETILPTAVFTDVTGAITGVLLAKFFRASRFPTVFLSATNAASTKDYAINRIPRTNIFFMNPGEPYDGTDMLITYACVSAAEPPADPNLIALTVKNPNSIEEAVIAGGIGLSTISQPTLTFADSGQIPSFYTAYINSDGKVDKLPQVVVCQVKLSVVGAAAQTVTLAMKGPAKIRVGLTKGIAGPTFNVKALLTGKDINGNTISETLTFDSSWAENTPPFCGENPKQFKTTTQLFAQFTLWTIIARSGDGPNTELMAWAMIDPVTTPQIEDILPVADVTWDAFKICRLEDTRPINTILQVPRLSKYSDGAKALAQLTTVMIGAGYLFNFWLEDFNQPKFPSQTYKELSPVFEPGSVTADVRKIGDGLDVRSLYVSRPVAPRPHSVGPFALRFIPIEPGAGFTFRIRVMVGGVIWSRWYNNTDLVGPQYTLFLGPLGASPLRKWQMVVHGECRGMSVVYLTTGPDPGIGLVFDVGAFDEGALG